MKIKLLVFFGIVLCGLVLSLLTLSKCGMSGDGPAGLWAKKPDKTDPGVLPNDPSTPSVSPSGPGSSNPNSNGTNSNGANSAASNSNSNTRTDSPNHSNPSGDDKPAAFRSGNDSPQKVAGALANAIKKKDFAAFLAAAGEESVPEAIRARLRALIESPTMQLSEERPFWEVAKKQNIVRWMLELVPVEKGAADSASIYMDIAKVADDQYNIAGVGFPPSVDEVVEAIEKRQAMQAQANANGNPNNPNGENPNTGNIPLTNQLELDSLTVAHAFASAVLTENFVAARKLCKPEITDERIAGLMIALEEGKFKLRQDRPLVVTFSKEDLTWVLSRVDSSEQSSEFAIYLKREDNWMVNRLTFGKVIRSLASGVQGPYSPLVEDPSGGESLVLYFEFDDAGLTRRADHQLRIVAKILQQDPDRRIRITGHADALGTDDYNRGLSQKRAEAIREAIISRGANPAQVISEGYGETQPRKPNFKADGTDNPLGRSENRRAEVYLDF